MIPTLIGNIQYGMPPETVKDTFLIEGGVPEYYIIPTQKFDWKDGINFMEFEFPVYCNFFIKKKVKTKIICDVKTQGQINSIFQETLLGPKDLSKFKYDFWDGYKAMPDIAAELKHFAVNPFNPTEPLKLEMFMEFITFEEKKGAVWDREIEVDEEQYLELISEGIIKKVDPVEKKRSFFRKKK